MCCLSDQTRPAHASDDFDAATVRELYLPKRDQYDLGQSKEPHALNILIDRVVLQDFNPLGDETERDMCVRLYEVEFAECPSFCVRLRLKF